jgi:hypothetical protein
VEATTVLGVWSVAAHDERFYQHSSAVASRVVTTATDTTPPGSADTPAGRRRGLRVAPVLVVVFVVVMIVFWTWALFFASKEAVNKIGDRAWAARAEEICADVRPQLRALELEASPDLTVRADLVVESTDLLARMLDDVEAATPADDKGRAIVPQWLADYRTLLDDRYRYADALRAGRDGPFTETPVNGVPITERIETFAGDNEMPSCAPPRGSVI